MKKLLVEMDWIFDYHFAYFLYNSHNINEYYDYMQAKWGSRYAKASGEL